MIFKLVIFFTLIIIKLLYDQLRAWWAYGFCLNINAQILRMCRVFVLCAEILVWHIVLVILPSTVWTLWDTSC